MDTSDDLQRLRQQLILAQVRIMELEDVRDELSPKLEQTESLLVAGQALADQKMDEAGHLARVQAELESQLEYLRHVQHVTNQALEEARAQQASVEALLQEERLLTTELRSQTEHMTRVIGSLEVRIQESEHQLNESRQLCTERDARIQVLDAELRGMKASRSWRWTSWIRWIERTFGSPR